MRHSQIVCIGLGFLVAVSFHIQSISAQENQPSVGQFVGTVSEYHGARLPGVDVTLTQAGAATKRTTDAGGRCAFEALPPGEYDLTARLTGFKMCAPKAPPVEVRAGQTTSMKILLAPAGFEEVHIRVVLPTVQSLWSSGAGVVHLRVSAQPQVIPETCDLLTAYQGIVVEVLKQSIRGEPVGSDARFVQESCSSCRPPFAQGDDLVAILHWIEDHYYVAYCWSIKDGRVVASDQQPVMQRFVGMRVADFIAELHKLIAERGER